MKAECSWTHTEVLFLQIECVFWVLISRATLCTREESTYRHTQTQKEKTTLSAGGWWCTENNAPMMMSPGMCATTRRSLDWAASAWSGPTQKDRTSSSRSIILVRYGNNGEADLRFTAWSRHRELLVWETLFLAMTRVCDTEEFLKWMISIYCFLLIYLSFLWIWRSEHHCNSWDRCSSATWEIQKKIWAKSH